MKTLKLNRLLMLLIAFLTMSINHVWATDVTLSNNDIKENSSKSSYSDDYDINGWTGRYMIATNKGVYALQLGYNTNSSKSAYNSHLTTPSFSGGITSITIKTNNGTASGREFYLCNANNLGTASSGNYGSGSTSAQNGSVTISVTGSPSQLHIYPNGTAYIEYITVSYSSGSTYTVV